MRAQERETREKATRVRERERHVSAIDLNARFQDLRVDGVGIGSRVYVVWSR